MTTSIKGRLAEARLSDERVLLEALSTKHHDDLRRVAYEANIWTYNTVRLSEDEGLKTYLERAEQDREAQTRFPFAIIDRKAGTAAGSTSLGNLSVRDQRIEIGWTWLGRPYQGTGLNRRVKYLLLSFAFDQLELERVEFKTDVLNQQSRRALLKIGATEEGVLRSHTLMQDGRRRNTIYYGILRGEWPAIKEQLGVEQESP